VVILERVLSPHVCCRADGCTSVFNLRIEFQVETKVLAAPKRTFRLSLITAAGRNWTSSLGEMESTHGRVRFTCLAWFGYFPTPHGYPNHVQTFLAEQRWTRMRWRTMR
jgi:hypothetical protein